MIAVATLLVAVVGATFAYFTATTNTTSGAANTTIETAKIGGTNFVFANEEGAKNYLNYPGGMAVIGASATATKEQDEEDENEYTLKYNLKITYDNNTKEALTWTLYRIAGTSKMASLDPACKLVVEPPKDVSGETHYYYNDEGKPSEGEATTPSNCTLSVEQIQSLESIATGTLLANQTSQTITSSDVSGLGNQSIDTDGSTYYYYLAVSYPNKNDDQNEDEPRTINVTLTVDGAVASSIKS